MLNVCRTAARLERVELCLFRFSLEELLLLREEKIDFTLHLFRVPFSVSLRTTTYAFSSVFAFDTCLGPCVAGRLLAFFSTTRRLRRPFFLHLKEDWGMKLLGKPLLPLSQQLSSTLLLRAAVVSSPS